MRFVDVIILIVKTLLCSKTSNNLAAVAAVESFRVSSSQPIHQYIVVHNILQRNNTNFLIISFHLTILPSYILTD